MGTTELERGQWGRQRCQPGGPCPPPWVPLHYAWSHWPSSFLLANSPRHFPITAGTAGALVDSTQFGALAFFLLVRTLVFLGEGGWSPRSWSLRARLGSVIPAFLGLEACSSGWVFCEAGGTGPEGRDIGELMGTEGFQECLNGILFFFHMGGSQSYVRVPFPGFLQQRIWDPSVFLGLARFLCVAGLQTP